jgi:hypothetical protein
MRFALVRSERDKHRMELHTLDADAREAWLNAHLRDRLLQTASDAIARWDAQGRNDAALKSIANDFTRVLRSADPVFKKAFVTAMTLRVNDDASEMEPI